MSCTNTLLSENSSLDSSLGVREELRHAVLYLSSSLLHYFSILLLPLLFFFLLLVQHTFLRGWELKIFSKAFMNLEHSSQYNKTVLRVSDFVQTPVCSFCPQPLVTPDFLYPDLKLTFSTRETDKRKCLFFSLN